MPHIGLCIMTFPSLLLHPPPLSHSIDSCIKSNRLNLESCNVLGTNVLESLVGTFIFINILIRKEERSYAYFLKLRGKLYLILS
jgi:hypothetical protein